MAVRAEQITLHRAGLAAAAAHRRMLDCLLVFPFHSGLTGADQLPSMVRFLQETTNCGTFDAWSPFLASLAEGVGQWTEDVLRRRADIWGLLASLAVPSRSFLRLSTYTLVS
ncbi:unnamed protein product [Symbiodinium natans]|uniref:Uncharacterized protein n=1 Tax=Symbiodinium natans TaxID=878477 RepID=A0A812QUA1_9DINO|nr:unnamed protein product [Symbiodinium natans]